MNFFKNSSAQIKFLRIYCIAAVLSLFITLFLPVTGEEGDYLMGTLEMIYNKEYLVRTLLNAPYGRPPLHNYFIVFFTEILGWQHVLIASRLVTALAAILTGISLYWFCQRQFKHKMFALLTTAIYFSGDLLFVRGWLAYSDTLFSLFIFLSIALLWLSLDNKSYRFLVLALVSLTAAFLTKALTAYVFYSVSALVLLWQHPNRKFLLSPLSILLHLFALMFPLIWLYYINPADQSMINDIFSTAKTSATLWQHISALFINPIHLILLFAPTSLLVIYLLWRKKIVYSTLSSSLLILLTSIILLNYLPYWISIKGGADPRYIEPLYPFIALFITGLLFASKEYGIRLACYCLLLTLVLKFIASIGFYYYEHHYRSDYTPVAQDIIAVTQGYPLYSRATEFTGLSTAATIDILQGSHKKPISYPPKSPVNGFILSNDNTLNLNEKLFKTYPLKRTPIYLITQGDACTV